MTKNIIEIVAAVDASVDMSDLTGQSILNNICLGSCGNERRTTAGAKKIAYVDESSTMITSSTSPRFCSPINEDRLF